MDLFIFLGSHGRLVYINKKFEHTNVNIFLPTSFNICLGAQKNRLTVTGETVLMSTQNLFCWEIRKKWACTPN